MKTPEEKGLTAHLLTELRKRRGYTNQEDAAAAIREATNVIGLTDSQYAAYESGDTRRPFQAKHRAAIESVWGPIGDDAPAATSVPATDLTQLIAAHNAVADAQNRVADELRAQREANADLAAAIREQSKIIASLVSRMSEERDQAPQWAEATVRAVFAGLQLREAGTSSSERPGADAPPAARRRSRPG